MAKNRYFVLREKGADTEHIFKGAAPRQAALKAANRGHTDIQLRERGRKNTDGTYTVHKFTGRKEVVDAPASKPDWMPAKINKGFVIKTGVEHVRL